MEQIIVCPNCGNKTIQEILKKVKSIDKAFSSANPNDFIEHNVTFYLTKCNICKKISLFADTEFHDNPGDLNNAILFFPNFYKLGNEIPLPLIEIFNEAKRIQHFSYTSFAVSIRRGLEFLCQDKKAKGRTLKQKIRDLCNNGIIPITLVEMAETLVFLGNISAHITKYKIDRIEVQAIEDFFIAMLEYVYIMPTKLNKLRVFINKKKQLV